MRTLLTGLIVLAALPLGSQTPKKSCVIVRIHQYKFGENMSRFHRHKAYEFVEGDFPVGMKFNSELDSGRVQEIKDKGGKVVILQSGYHLPELQDAREQCKTFITAH